MARQVTTAAVNEARNSHNQFNPVTGLYERTLLLEGSRTNVALWSEDISAAAHVGSLGVTYVSNSTLSPDGVNITADTLVQSSATDVHFHRQDAPVSAAGEPIAVSRYLKAATGSVATLNLSNGMSAIATFDLAAGTVTATSGAQYVRSGITPYGNGWYRCWLVGTSTGTAHRFMTYPQASTASFAGDGTTAIYVWGGQIELNAASPSSYNPTTTVAVTRAVDILTRPFTLPPQEMTVYVKYIDRGTNLGVVSPFLFQIGLTSAASPRLWVYVDGTGVRGVWSDGGGVSQSITPANPVGFGEQTEVRIAMSSAGVLTAGVSRNGAPEAVTVGAAAASPLPAAWNGTTLCIGSRAGNNAGFAAYALPGGVKVARGVKTMAEMRVFQGAA
ncbi:MAG: hypothetical protein H0X64_08175 [Gemmatimonadaceae bacterium]|nr:hypothetical protein [Gemmatimonadaceae bacterium]